MPRPQRQSPEFRAGESLIAARDFTFGGRAYKKGDSFPYKRLSISQRQVLTLFRIGRIGHTVSMGGGEVLHAEDVPEAAVEETVAEETAEEPVVEESEESASEEGDLDEDDDDAPDESEEDEEGEDDDRDPFG